ncbi:MAG: response regulator transcription factor [Lawsonibacter sp.]|jgi:two-component system response regulator VicR
MAKILVVDDEQVLVKGIKFNLEHEGYQVEAGYDGEQAVELAREGNFDLVILDLMMPKIDGLQACMRIREFSNVPVIMLTAKGEDTDKIMGFECGADDYITKPFNILELKARVRALLRRAGAAEKEKKQAGSELVIGHIKLDVGERSAWKDGQNVELTAKEFDLMELLMRNPGRVYSRENLLNVVWGYEYIGDYRTVDVHVRRLREKLELDPANPEYIRTKWGVGYYLSNHGEERGQRHSSSQM